MLLASVLGIVSLGRRKEVIGAVLVTSGGEWNGFEVIAIAIGAVLVTSGGEWNGFEVIAIAIGAVPKR